MKLRVSTESVLINQITFSGIIHKEVTIMISGHLTTSPPNIPVFSIIDTFERDVTSVSIRGLADFPCYQTLD